VTALQRAHAVAEDGGRAADDQAGDDVEDLFGLEEAH
jgi:hypothetical protein